MSDITAVDVGAFIARGAAVAGRRILVRDAHGAWSGDDLARRSGALAGALQNLGAGRGSRVLLGPGTGVERLEGYWALLRLGAVPVVADTGTDLVRFARAAGATLAICHTDQLATCLQAGIEGGIVALRPGEKAGAGWVDYAAALSAPPVAADHQAADDDLCALAPWETPDGALAIARRSHRAVAVTGGVAAVYHGSQPSERLLVAANLDGWLLEALLFAVLCGNAQAYLLGSSSADTLRETIGAFLPTTVLTDPETAMATAGKVPAPPGESDISPLWNIHVPLNCAQQIDLLTAAVQQLPGGWIGQILLGASATGGVAAWYRPEQRWHPLPTVDIAVRRQAMATPSISGAGEMLLRSPQLAAGFLDPPDTQVHCARGWFHAAVEVAIDACGFLVNATAPDDPHAARAGDAAAGPAELASMTAIDIGAFMDRGARFHGHRPLIQVNDDLYDAATVTDRSHRLSTVLTGAYGIRRGDRVAMLLHNGREFLEVYWACARIGAAVVPVNFRLQPEEIGYTLRDSGARVLIAEPEHRAWHTALHQHAPALERILTTGPVEPQDAHSYEALLATATLDADDLLGQPLAHEDEPCSILYTAGTTGFPKGAVRTHKAVLWYALNCNSMGGSPGDRGEVYLAVPPMFHIAGHETRVPMTVMRGSKMVILTAFDPRQVLDVIERERITGMFVPPTMGHVLLQTMAEGAWDLSSWKEWISASAPLPGPVRDRALQLLPGLQFSNSLGMTEAGVLATASFEVVATKPGACVGRPAPTVELAIVDPAGQVLGKHQTGEITVRSPQVIGAYWGKPEATVESMRHGRFHTGDVGMLDEDGDLHILDRIKDMIITGGENVYAPEVESQLFAMPEVADAAVFGLPHEKWGETVTAVLALKPGQTVAPEDVIARCRDRIAHYKCPTRGYFTDALPRNAMGKVMKAVLRKQYA